MNLQEAKELKEKMLKFFESETEPFIQHNIKNMLMTLDPIIAVLELEEAEKIISDRSLNGEQRIKERLKKLRSQLPEAQRCSRCPNPLFDAMKSSDEEPYVIDDKPVCRDCYFNELGDFIEKYPIGGIGRRT